MQKKVGNFLVFGGAFPVATTSSITIIFSRVNFIGVIYSSLCLKTGRIIANFQKKAVGGTAGIFCQRTAGSGKNQNLRVHLYTHFIPS